MAQRDYTVKVGGKLIAGRVRLAGKVSASPQFVIGARQSASIGVDVCGELYQVMIKPSKRVLDIEVGEPIVVIGRLVRNVLWAERGRFVTCGPMVTPGIVEL